MTSTDYITPANHRSNKQLNRFSPQKIIDQGTAVQLGGTVQNANLNRDENVPDRKHTDDETVTTVVS